MKIKLFGNYSGYHCGCSAVWSVLTKTLLSLGHQIVKEEPYDVFIINGEGSLHSGKVNFHRKMNLVAEEYKKGKIICLVNTSWQNNPNEYDHILKNMKIISVREEASKNELKTKHNIDSDFCLDYSFYEEIKNLDYHINFQKQIVYTDIFSKEKNIFIKLEHPSLKDALEIDMKHINWNMLVHSLKTSKLLITGRHHAIYAACKAKIPFIIIDSNTHKSRGLIQQSKIDIPIIKDIKDLNKWIDWSKNNQDTYEKFFSWMDKTADQINPTKILSKI